MRFQLLLCHFALTTAELCADSVLLFSMRALSLPWLVIWPRPLLQPGPSNRSAAPSLRAVAFAWYRLPHSQLKGNVGTHPRDRERTRVFSRTSRAFGDSDLGKNVRNPSLRVQLYRPPIPATTLSIFRQNYYAKEARENVSVAVWKHSDTCSNDVSTATGNA